MDNYTERIEKLVDCVISELENRKCEDMCMSEILHFFFVLLFTGNFFFFAIVTSIQLLPLNT